MDCVDVLSDKRAGSDVASDKEDNTVLDDNVEFSLPSINTIVQYKGQGSQELPSKDGKETSDLHVWRSNHIANVAFYVEDDNTRKVYAVANLHVINLANEFYIQMRNKEGFILLGSPLKSLKTNDGSIDVGLIEVDHSIRSKVINKEGQDQHVSIYKDSFNSIYGLEVFKYRPGKGTFDVLSCDTPNTGIIASNAEHKEQKELFEKENGQFLVKSKSCPFSVEGESGTALAVKTKFHNVVTLIGIICGGFERYTVCQFLPIFFSHYEKRYGMKLQIDICDRTSVLVSDKLRYIPFGIKISFTCICKSPEQIAPLNFDLVDRALDLMCLKYVTFDVTNHERLLVIERRLSLLVSKRESLQNCSVFENDKPDYVAVEQGLMACDYLYNGNAREAELCLKKAVFCVPKMDNFGLRIFWKLTTYITWFCLVSNTSALLEQLRNFLDEGIEIIEDDNYKLVGFPKEALGYLFFDFSRYYMCEYDRMRKLASSRQITTEGELRKQATLKAERAVGIFQQDHDSKKTKETYRRLVLAKSQLAYVLLGCGHEFNVIPDEVPNANVTKAEDIIKSVQCDKFDVPLVEQVDLWIASIDLDYRKNCIKDALEKTYTCLKLSEGKDYFIGIQRAKFRQDKLQDALEKQTLV